MAIRRPFEQGDEAMNSNFLLKQLTILSFLALLSCGDSMDTVSGGRQGLRHRPQVKGLPHKPGKSKISSKKCPSRFISTKTPCFYTLPELSDGEYFPVTFQDTEKKETKGIVLGRGKWYCKNGVWKTVEEPFCYGCNPGRSLEYCWNEWKKRKP